MCMSLLQTGAGKSLLLFFVVRFIIIIILYSYEEKVCCNELLTSEVWRDVCVRRARVCIVFSDGRRNEKGQEKATKNPRVLFAVWYLSVTRRIGDLYASRLWSRVRTKPYSRKVYGGA